MSKNIDFNPEKYLTSPSYDKMSWNLTGDQVRTIAERRIKEREKLRLVEDASKSSDTAWAGALLKSLEIERVPSVSRRETSVPSITTDSLHIEPINLADVPLPRIEATHELPWAEEWKREIPDTPTILAMKPAELEKVFENIIKRIKSGWKFSFANIDDTTFWALQAVYANWRIPTRSLVGSEFIHWLANSIIQSGEIWDKKRLITNDPDHQKLFSEVVLRANSSSELKTLLIEWNSAWGKLAPWRTAWGEKQWWGVATWAEVGSNLEWKTQDFLNALRAADPAYGRLYSVIWTYTADKDIWSQLRDSLLHSPWFKDIRDAIVSDILGRAAIKKGIFFKTETYPEIAGKNTNDIDITNIFSSGNIPNWIEFNIEGKSYIIGSSLRDGIVILSKEAASKKYETIRLRQG